MLRKHFRDFARLSPGFLALVICLFSALPLRAQGEVTGPVALERLMAGNERFVTGRLQAKNYAVERPQLAAAQHPYAIVLACADSRVPPELVFDESLGKLFIVRTAGHVVDAVALGSIEYAVEHLHVNLLIVLGHDGCGAVKATLSGGEATPNIAALLTRIKPAVDKALAAGTDDKHLLAQSVKENVRYQMQKAVYGSEVLGNAVYERKLTIAGGVYHLDTGRVELISSDLAVERTGPAASESAEAGETRIGAAEKTPPAEKEPKGAEPRHVEPGKRGQGEAEGKEPKKRAEIQLPADFPSRLRVAFENKLEVMVRKTTLMRDANDRCLTVDCRSLAAGAAVKLENPNILSVMGRPQIKVRYRGRTFYINAEADALEIASR